MTTNTNFVGKNGFTWWVGIIENRIDPMCIGRCQVRIFGWHELSPAILPTKDLPWAIPVYPINATKTFCAPQKDDWVLGFFLDGESGQFPVMLGVFQGINTTEGSIKV